MVQGGNPMTRLDEVRAMTRDQLMEALECAETGRDHDRMKRKEAEAREAVMMRVVEAVKWLRQADGIIDAWIDQKIRMEIVLILQNINTGRMS